MVRGWTACRTLLRCCLNVRLSDAERREVSGTARRAGLATTGCAVEEAVRAVVSRPTRVYRLAITTAREQP